LLNNSLILLAQSYNFAVRKKEQMVSIEKKIGYLEALGEYMLGASEEWQTAKDRAVQGNQWFTEEQIEIAVKNIVSNFLQAKLLKEWLQKYEISSKPKVVGITMAGNIPLVGFHDFLCGYLSGHQLRLKLSSKDQILLTHLLQKLSEWDASLFEQIQLTDNLRNCDAYIATGSNNTARYFEQYFGKYPHIIRRNRTSVAVLDGSESVDNLKDLAKDVFLYFGLGCRNVTQICVPKGYDFQVLFEAFEPYKEYINHNKYRNNYDYYLAIYLLNKVPYLSNDALLLVENNFPFSAVSVLHYRYYDDKTILVEELTKSVDLQCIVGNSFVPFGKSQIPNLSDFADGVDTMAFLCSL
jgi:hypothetical protein